MAEKEQTAEVAEQEEKSEEGTQETPESAKPKPSNELKVVIIIKDSRVMLGVQSPDCDPVYTTLEGTLAAALKRVPKLVEEAKQKWSTSPLNPNANHEETNRSTELLLILDERQQLTKLLGWPLKAE